MRQPEGLGSRALRSDVGTGFSLNDQYGTLAKLRNVHEANLRCLLQLCLCEHEDRLACDMAILLLALRDGQDLRKHLRRNHFRTGLVEDYYHTLMAGLEVMWRAHAPKEKITRYLRGLRHGLAAADTKRREETALWLALVMASQGDLNQCHDLVRSCLHDDLSPGGRFQFLALSGIICYQQWRQAVTGDPQADPDASLYPMRFDRQAWLNWRNNRQVKELRDNAEHDLKEALRLEPSAVLLATLLCHLYVQSGRMSDALEVAGLVYRAVPADVNTCGLLTVVATAKQQQSDIEGVPGETAVSSEEEDILAMKDEEGVMPDPQKASEDLLASDPEVPHSLHDLTAIWLRALDVEPTSLPGLRHLLHSASHCALCEAHSIQGCLKHLDASRTNLMAVLYPCKLLWELGCGEAGSQGVGISCDKVETSVSLYIWQQVATRLVNYCSQLLQAGSHGGQQQAPSADQDYDLLSQSWVELKKDLKERASWWGWYLFGPEDVEVLDLWLEQLSAVNCHNDNGTGDAEGGGGLGSDAAVIEAFDLVKHKSIVAAFMLGGGCGYCVDVEVLLGKVTDHLRGKTTRLAKSRRQNQPAWSVNLSPTITQHGADCLAEMRRVLQVLGQFQASPEGAGMGTEERRPLSGGETEGGLGLVDMEESWWQTFPNWRRGKRTRPPADEQRPDNVE